MKDVLKEKKKNGSIRRSVQLPQVGLQTFRSSLTADRSSQVEAVVQSSSECTVFVNQYIYIYIYI